MKQIDALSVSAIRSTCIDGINKAKSGHPGMALGSAPILYTLFKNHLISDPKNPDWINRDRFVLSAGHASMLLYTMLHIAGYDVSIDDLKSFRQVNSKTPGHPEFTHTKGVDATSGPLGQGIAQAVGMAMAEKMMQAKYGDKLINHYTYCLCGDGCLHEGLSQEAISLAGHLKLDKLILFYDSNAITLDGKLDMSFSEDVKKRFEASEWNVLEVGDGNDLDAIDEAINEAKKSDKPVIIIVHTIIGYGSIKAGTSKVHGSPLGEEDGLHAKKDVYGYDYPPFEIPEEVYESMKNSFIVRGQKSLSTWNDQLNILKVEDPSTFELLSDAIAGNVDKYLKIENLFDESIIKTDSTRNSSGLILNKLMNMIPNLYGGSADVAGSVMTKIIDGVDFDKDHYNGHNINFGIREFAMASALNGMLLHGGVRGYAGCFLIFADYMKSAIRMAAISNLPAIYLFSHDSIAVGEDGPTHQPIEHLAMLRSIPNVDVFRPADAREMVAGWIAALKSDKTPTALILSRQNLPLLAKSDVDKASKGAYVLVEDKGFTHEIIATGSEVALALEAKEILNKEGYKLKIISMPSTSIFDRQDEKYQNEVLSLNHEHRISIEMLSTFGWQKYAKHNLGINTFGASGKAADVIKYFGFDLDSIVERIRTIIK